MSCLQFWSRKPVEYYLLDMWAHSTQIFRVNLLKTQFATTFSVNFGCDLGLAIHRTKLTTAVVVLTRLQLKM